MFPFFWKVSLVIIFQGLMRFPTFGVSAKNMHIFFGAERAGGCRSSCCLVFTDSTDSSHCLNGLRCDVLMLLGLYDTS